MKTVKDIFDFQKASKKDVIGIVFYMGEHVIEIDEQNFAVPFGMFFLNSKFII